jgi:hypothetical protein
MAFTTDLTIQGRVYPDAYIKIDYITSSTRGTSCVLTAWDSQAARDANYAPLTWSNNLAVVPLTDITADNPIAYAYAQLEASGLYPDATWNI